MPSPMRFLTVAAMLVLAACSDAGPTDVAVTEAKLRSAGQAFTVQDISALGAAVFADKNLSVNRNQSCETCHEPSEGFAGAVTGVVTRGSAIQGSVPGMFGARKPPTAAYATLTPIFTSKGAASGGLFWDGRATGLVLGSPAADQAAFGPFINPVEQALPDPACVVYRVSISSYGSLYPAAWGTLLTDIAFPANTETVCSTPQSAPGNFLTLSSGDRTRAMAAFNNIARSVAQFEATFNKFSSAADAGRLTAQEQEGLKLFGDKGKCHQCHFNKGARAVFTDFGFHNLGVPKNPDNVKYNYQTTQFDPGLGGFTGVATQVGKFRTPTIRNVGMGVNRTYMHNGVFTSLRQVVDFYNTRDVLRTCTRAEIAALKPSQYGSYGAKCWPAPEYAGNRDSKQLGNLGLTESQVNAVVAYLKAMSDQ